MATVDPPPPRVAAEKGRGKGRIAVGMRTGETTQAAVATRTMKTATPRRDAMHIRTPTDMLSSRISQAAAVAAALSLMLTVASTSAPPVRH